MKYLRLLALAALFFATHFSSAQSNLVLFISSPGDYIGGGQTDVTTNASDFTFSGSASQLTVNAFGYYFNFSPGSGGTLTVGAYPNTTRFNGSSPSLDIYGNGRGCDNDCGSFQVLEFHTDGSGAVDRLWMTYSNSCECFGDPETGEIRYHSLLAPPVPQSRTLHVPVDYPTIQAALNAAGVLNSDTVLVSPGTYNEGINFNGKAIHLLSTGGPASTIIASTASQNTVSFTSGETSNAIISGFTISNGSSGIYLANGASPTISSNFIVGNGTGVYTYFASPIVLNGTISSNSGDAVYLGGGSSAVVQGNVIQYNGGGIGMNSSGSPVIANNFIQHNNGDAINGVNDSDVNVFQNVIAYNSGSALSFLVPSGSRGPVAVNNTIVGNGYGISISGYDGASQIINNIIVGNNAVNLSYFNSPTVPIFQNNDIYSSTGNAYAGVVTNLAGTNGNISVDPAFTCNPSGDYRLLPGSPAIDAGINNALGLTATDLLGHPRILVGKTNGSAIVDLGAYEFNPATPTTPCLYLNPPSNIVAVAVAGQNSAVVTFPAPDATPTATVTCVPPSGSVFPAGTNTVLCTLVYGTNLLTANFTVTVEVPPFVTNQPTFINVLANGAASFSVGALGTTPLAYQWSFGGNPIFNATNSVLVVSNVQATNEGYYQVLLENNFGTATSLPIQLRVLPSAPMIVSNPLPLSVLAGSQAVFSAGIIGTAPLSFQWYKNSTVIPGASSSQLIISNAQTADAGVYQVQASNSLGIALSTGASLTVIPAKPAFVLQPVSTGAVSGTNVSFTALALGTDDGLHPLTYSWYFQSNRISGQTGPTLTLNSITASNQGAYYAVATNVYGSATSATAQLTVFFPPAITLNLSNQIVDAGKTLVLNSGANGTSPLAFSWSFNGLTLLNTNASLALANASPYESGFYSVTVTNLYGSATATARVSVFLPPSGIVAWGDNSGGQLNVPTNLDDAVAVAGGDYHTVALRHDGTLVAWGSDSEGQIDVPTNSLPFVAVAAGADHNLAITEDGSVVAWGRNDAGQATVPNYASPALSVAAGESHSLDLLATGDVVAWGDNSYGQTNLPPILLRSYIIYFYFGEYFYLNYAWVPATAIAAGRNHNLALLSTGTVVGWGDDEFGQSSPPANLSNVVAIAAGYLHSVALTANGTVAAWGDNSLGQTNVPPGLSNVVAIAAGDFHNFALLATGQVVAWGDNDFGQTNVPPGAVNPVGLGSGYYDGFALEPANSLLYPQMTSRGLVIQWHGAGNLQSAPTPTGPFTDLPGTGNSYTNTDMSTPARFFRLRH